MLRSLRPPHSCHLPLLCRSLRLRSISPAICEVSRYHLSWQIRFYRSIPRTSDSSIPSPSAGSPESNSPSDEPSQKVSPEDEEPDWELASYKQLPKNFGSNQYMHVDDALKERLRGLLWQFRAPIRYAFAYGSGVFSQGTVSVERPMIDLIFGVTYAQHWHSINLNQNRHHYSFIGSLGSRAVSYVQDQLGAGVYFNPYVEVNGTLIKYGVVSIDTLCRDLAEWETLYLAGRLHKPVKILRDDPRVRLANHINLLSAIRVALLLLPEKFTEHTLYSTIAGISYMGDPRMRLPTENPNKVANIVSNQLTNFRRLYSPLIETLPNVDYISSSSSGGSENVAWGEPPETTILIQDMDPVRRGNIVRRLPKSFREKLYFQYQSKYQIPRLEFERMIGISPDDERKSKRTGGEFEQRIGRDTEHIHEEVGQAIRKTIGWPSTAQSIKGLITAGPVKSMKYTMEKMRKWKEADKSKSAS